MPISVAEEQTRAIKMMIFVPSLDTCTPEETVSMFRRITQSHERNELVCSDKRKQETNGIGRET